MSHIKDLIYFSDDVNKWNYSPLVLNPNINPYKNKAFNNNRNQEYDGLKYNCAVMLKEILKYSNNLFSEDLKQHIFKKSLLGTKSNYWNILNITVYIFNYYLFRSNNNEINYKSFRKLYLKTPFYLESDKKLNEFDGDNEFRKQEQMNKYIKNKTYDQIYNKVLEIEDNEIKEKFIIISKFLKDKILCDCALHKLY
jgi:hypothetical protein